MVRKAELQSLGYWVDEEACRPGSLLGQALVPLRQAVLAEDWQTVDASIQRLTAPSGLLFQVLQQYHFFQHIEFIISVRDAADPEQEDGIWHDDGSRSMAFTLSLTPDAAALEGGKLGIRRKGEASGVLLPTAPFGTLFLYLTGQYGVEHRIHQVTKGRRIVIAGWCSVRSDATGVAPQSDQTPTGEGV